MGKRVDSLMVERQANQPEDDGSNPISTLHKKIVLPIKPHEAEPWIVQKHYAHRLPCVKYAFGLYIDGDLLGVVTYGPPPTPVIQQNIFGGEYTDIVLELNRLIVECADRNAPSFLVSHSLRLLPKPSCVVSYADSSQNHIGYVYQSTNFLYTGAVTAHDSEYMINGKKTHPRTLAGRGITDPTRWAREHGVETVKPKPKYRYVYLCGNKNQRNDMLKRLRYPIIKDYPKETSNDTIVGGASQYNEGCLYDPTHP